MALPVKTNRNINVEILRIVSIFLIIFNHYSAYGGFVYDNPLSINAMTVEFLHVGGKIGVDIFILISGWFMSKSEKFNVKKIVSLSFQVLFYSVILAVIGFVLKTQSIKETIQMLGAIPFGNWIFITSYFMLFCLSPFLNLVIQNISKKSYISLLVFLGITWCIIPTFANANFDMSNTAWYIYLYLLAGFLHKYEDSLPKKPVRWLGISIGSLVLILLSEVVLEYMGVHIAPVFGANAERFRGMNSILAVSVSVFALIGVIQLKPNYNRIVPKIASTSLAIFMLHDNGALRPVLWTEVFKTVSFTDSPFLLIHAVITAVIIFVVGCLIDLLRQAIMDKFVLGFLYCLIEKIESKYDRLLSKAKIDE